MSEEQSFGFKDLLVWQKSIDFAQSVIEVAESNNSERKHFRLLEQIEAASASVSMNIAEGKGRYSKKEFVHYLYISRGSLYETITLLNIFYRMKWISIDELSDLEQKGQELGKMLNGLINSIKKSI
ncbi:MAG: four helix bundle protein [Cyclobacteriaceae bacterium]